MLAIPDIEALAQVATQVLSMVVNQAGVERKFSDVKIKKSRLRNRIGIKKLEKMIIVSIIPLCFYNSDCIVGW